MQLFLVSIRRVTSVEPERLYAKIGARDDSEEGSIDVSFEIEIKGTEVMGLTLTQIESQAVSRAKAILGQ